MPLLHVLQIMVNLDVTFILPTAYLLWPHHSQLPCSNILQKESRSWEIKSKQLGPIWVQIACLPRNRILGKTDQALIWTLYVFEIQMHPLFQKKRKIYLVWKVPKRHLGRCTLLFCYLFKALKWTFLKFGALFIPSFITTTFYYFFLFCFFLTLYCACVWGCFFVSG